MPRNSQSFFTSMYLEYTCGGNLTGSEGNFTSPGYPVANYPNNFECVWTIGTNQGSGMFIDFKNMRVACTYYYDFVQVSYHTVKNLF